MKKKSYVQAELDVMLFKCNDIVTASGGDDVDSDNTDWGGGQPVKW